MGRQVKKGIDYFSHDVNMLSDRKMKLLKAKHGLIGYAIYLRLLELLYEENGYYLKIDEEFNILFIDENNLEENVYINVLNDCINYNLFEENMYKNYSILTSKRIQSNYFSATERRKSVEIIKEYALAEIINVNINLINVDIGTQSKVKNSKVKNNKVINEEQKPEKKVTKRFVPPTIKEISEYCLERKNKVNPERFLSHYESNGWKVGKNKMKDWKAAVRTWERNDFNNSNGNKDNGQFSDEIAEKRKREVFGI